MFRHDDGRREHLARRLRALDAVLCRFGWLLLVLSVLANLVRLAQQPAVATIDLWVYREGAPHLLTGDLWSLRVPDPGGAFPLPFTYPPFAALVLIPLSWLPWPVVQYGWRILSLAALWFVVRRSLAVVSEDAGATGVGARRRARSRSLYWTAFVIVLEPVHSTLNFGQINLVLAALVMAGLTTRRGWTAGLAIGLAAGIKLVPAVSGLYFVARSRWAAVIASVVAFCATVALGYLVAPELSVQYFGASILGDKLAGRVPVGSVINQSLRGALSRSAGHDVGTGPLWVAAVLVALLLTVVAARAAVKARDRLALIVVVELFGLLASPVSWSHYWVWVVPVLIWSAYGPVRRARPVMAVGLLWALLTGSLLVTWLLKAQPTIWEFGRPWYLSLLGWAYPGAGLLTIAVIGRTLSRRPGEPFGTRPSAMASGTVGPAEEASVPDPSAGAAPTPR